MSITGILLAAGQSQRFGSDKLLQPVVANLPMVVISARQLRQAVDQMIVVIRPAAKTLAQRLNVEGFQIVVCERAHEGMGASLACGVRASLESQAWVIALADMPFIRLTTIQGVVSRLRQGHTIVAPQSQGRRGHPVGFQQQLGSQLMTLSGDRGAQVLLQHYPLTLFPCDDAGIHQDIDIPKDMEVKNNEYTHS